MPVKLKEAIENQNTATALQTKARDGPIKMSGRLRRSVFAERKRRKGKMQMMQLMTGKTACWGKQGHTTTTVYLILLDM